MLNGLTCLQLSTSDFSLLVQLFQLVQSRCETPSCEVGSISGLFAGVLWQWEVRAGLLCRKQAQTEE